MIYLVVLIIAFLWLFWETKWLTIRIEIPSKTQSLINALIHGIIGVMIAVSLMKFENYVLIALPSYYRRYIERVRKSTGDYLFLPDSKHPMLVEAMQVRLVVTLNKVAIKMNNKLSK